MTDTISNASATDHSIDSATNAFAELLAPEPPDTPEEGEALQAETEDTPQEEPETDYEPVEEADEEPEDEADPEDIEETNDEDEPEQPVYTVKVNGEEITVSLDELQKGYSRLQDYTRKTQQVAELRKQAEAETEAVRAERAQYSQLLGALRQQAEGAAFAQVDWNKLRQEDPIEFAAKWAEHQQSQQRLQAIQAEQARVAQLQQQEQAQNIAAAVEREREILQEVIPEWRDPEVARREKAEIVTFGKQLGFQAEELAEITDHRAVVALRKAYLYDKLQATRAKVKPSALKPTLKPGPAQTASKKSDLKQAKQRLAKSGQVADAAAAFESLLLGRG